MATHSLYICVRKTLFLRKWPTANMANKQIFVHNGSLHYLEDFQLFWRRGKRCWNIARNAIATYTKIFFSFEPEWFFFSSRNMRPVRAYGRYPHAVFLCLPVHPITVWPTSPYCPITTSTHHTQSCQAGSTVTPLLIALVFSTPSVQPTIPSMSDTYMYNVMWRAAMKHSYRLIKKTCPKALHRHRDSNIHSPVIPCPIPSREKLPAELPYKKNFPLNCTRTKEDEPTLYLDSYTRHPQTQTLPRSRAARELYFSANSDNLMSTAEKCHFSACPSTPSLSDPHLPTAP